MFRRALSLTGRKTRQRVNHFNPVMKPRARSRHSQAGFRVCWEQALTGWLRACWLLGVSCLSKYVL